MAVSYEQPGLEGKGHAGYPTLGYRYAKQPKKKKGYYRWDLSDISRVGELVRARDVLTFTQLQSKYDLAKTE